MEVLALAEVPALAVMQLEILVHRQDAAGDVWWSVSMC